MIDVPHNMRLRRVLCPDDHKFLVDLHNDPEVLRNITNPTPITMEDHMSWWYKIERDDNEQRFIFTVDDTRVGFTKFYNIDRVNRNCVLGADIHKDHRGHGYAKFMWSLMLKYCFFDLSMHRVSLTTAQFNCIGPKLYIDLGFVIEGMNIDALCRDDVYYNCIMMYMTRDMWLRS